jgi:hypothetical protein
MNDNQMTFSMHATIVHHQPAQYDASATPPGMFVDLP